MQSKFLVWILAILILCSFADAVPDLPNGLIHSINFAEDVAIDYPIGFAETYEEGVSRYMFPDCINGQCIKLNTTGYMQFYGMNVSMTTTPPFTYSYWVYYDSAVLTTMLGFGNGVTRWLDKDEGTLLIYDDVAEWFKTSDIRTPQWHIITYRGLDNGSIEQWVDGVLLVSDYGLNSQSDYDDILFGTQYPELLLAGSSLDGRLDEFNAWDRALTDEEIDFLWNNGTGVFYPLFKKPAAPAINLTYPGNDTILNVSSDINQTNVTFIFTIDGVYPCYWNISSGSFVDSASFTSVLGSNNRTDYTLNGSKRYNWTVQCINGGSTTLSDTYNFYVNITGHYALYSVPAPVDWSKDIDVNTTPGILLLFFYLAVIITVFTFGILLRIPFFIFIAAAMMFFFGFIIAFKVSILFGILVTFVGLIMFVVGALML